MAQKTLILFLLFSTHVWAADETFGPITMTFPEGWKCSPENNNYVCLNESESGQKNALAILAYKQASASDQLNIYKDQLSRPKNIIINEIATPSEVKKVTNITVNGVAWVEAIHHNSEVAGYYTHYLVTVHQGYAVLITFSIYDVEYDKLLNDMRPIMTSMVFNAASASPPAVEVPQPQANEADTSQATEGRPESIRLQQPTVQLFGHNIPKKLFYLGIVFIAVLMLLGYAVVK